MIRFEASKNMSKEWNMLTSNNKVCTRRRGEEWRHHQMKRTQDGNTICPFRFGLTARKSKIEIGAECVCVLQIRQINTTWKAGSVCFPNCMLPAFDSKRSSRYLQNNTSVLLWVSKQSHMSWESYMLVCFRLQPYVERPEVFIYPRKSWLGSQTTFKTIVKLQRTAQAFIWIPIHQVRFNRVHLLLKIWASSIVPLGIGNCLCSEDPCASVWCCEYLSDCKSLHLATGEQLKKLQNYTSYLRRSLRRSGHPVWWRQIQYWKNLCISHIPTSTDRKAQQ